MQNMSAISNMESKWMCSKLSYYQLKTRLLYAENVICESHSKHKGKT